MGIDRALLRKRVIEIPFSLCLIGSDTVTNRETERLTVKESNILAFKKISYKSIHWQKWLNTEESIAINYLMSLTKSPCI